MERTAAWWQRSRLELERKLKIDAIDNMIKSHDCDASHSCIELSWSAGHPRCVLVSRLSGCSVL